MRVVRWAFMAVGVLALTVLAAASAALVLAQTGTGREWIAERLERALSDDESKVAISDLGGSVPFGMTVGRIEVRDGQGVWLTVEDAALDIRAADLLARRL